MTRILHVVDSLEIGGLERMATDLAVAQRERGHEVAVLSIVDTDGFRPQLERAGVPVFSGSKSGPLDRRTIATLRDLMRERGIEAVHTHGFVPNYYAAAALVSGRQRAGLVTTCHDMGSRLAGRQLRWLYRLSLLRTTWVAMVGAQVRDKLVDLGVVPSAKARVVRNGIPVERFQRTIERRHEARRRLELPLDALVIGTTGRQVDLKNHSLLLSAFAGLRKRMQAAGTTVSDRELRLVLIGAGPLSDDLKAEAGRLGIRDAVTFTGARQDIPELLPGLDVFALPSRTEGLSIALLEACATGLAIVATDVGGNPEIIRDGQTGLLVTSEDLDGLIDALQRFAESPEFAQALGDAAHDWVGRNASMQYMADEYQSLYADAGT